jgi:hypothetical protein
MPVADVLLAVAAAGRCLASDLIGMGDSGKPGIVYTIDDHAWCLGVWFDALVEGVPGAYRRPYPTRQSRLPLLQWPRAMPHGHRGRGDAGTRAAWLSITTRETHGLTPTG